MYRSTMQNHQALNLTLIVLILTNYCVLGLDLLDEYVRHVERVNQIPEPSFKSNSEASFSEANYQRGATRGKRHTWSSDEDLDSDITSVGVQSRNKRDVISDLLDEMEWTHRETLDDRGDVVLKWQPRHQEILFRVEAKTRGYVGVGFSPNGGMRNADIVIGWVQDYTGRAFLLDCHGADTDEERVPIRDEVNNYTLIRGLKNDTYTILEFRRVLDTCDPHDFILNSDTVRVIWALSEEDPHYDFDLAYHGERRGTQNVHLLGPPPTTMPPKSTLRQWDVTLNSFEVKQDMSTMYWCRIFKSPNMQRPHHIVGYEPLIGANHSSYLHHMLLHECELGAGANLAQWEQYAEELGRPCYGAEMPVAWERCITPTIAWAIGSKGENFPKHVGLPLQSHKFYMLEVHFDNPSMKRSRDTSGVRLHYTSQLRENVAGILVTGVALSSLHVIPPQQKEYRSAGYCSFGCTEATINKTTGISIVSVLLHSHLAGRKIRLRHIRGDRELPPIAQDDHYDFNYQQSRSLALEVRVLPGDGLVTECTYSTLKRKRPTLGGYSTKEEMCLAFVLHYPRTELAGCYSMPPVRYFFSAYGVKEFYGRNMSEVERVFLQGGTENSVTTPTTKTPLFPPYKPGDELSPEANDRAIQALRNAKDYIEGAGNLEFSESGDHSNSGYSLLDQLVIREPTEFSNKTFMRHLNDMPYVASVTRKIEEYFYSGLHLTFCRRRDDSLVVTERVEKFPTFEPYIDTSTPKFQCSYRVRSSANRRKGTLNEILILFIICLFNKYTFN